MIKFSENNETRPQILAIGIGGAGANVIDKINNYNLNGIRTLLIDSEESSTAKEKFCIPNKLIKELGKEEDNTLINQELIKLLKPFLQSLPKTEMVFTISGLGGSTGTGITAHLVQLLKEKSQCVFSLCTIPFFFEGKPKIINSLKKLKLIQQNANASFIVSHDKVFKMVDKNLSMREAFTPANNLFAELITSINKLTMRGKKDNLISIGFSDIKKRITNKLSTLFWVSEAQGESRIELALEQVISSPLLGRENINSAESLILGIFGGETLTLDSVKIGIEYLHKYVPKNADIIFGAAVDSSLRDTVKVGLIATGLEASHHTDSWDLSMSGTVVGKDTGLFKKTSILNRSPQQFQKPQQTMIDFKKSYKGQFEKSEATVYGGEDLDIPAFLRKKKS